MLTGYVMGLKRYWVFLFIFLSFPAFGFCGVGTLKTNTLKYGQAAFNPNTDSCEILPLGDSLTVGVGSDNSFSYRGTLQSFIGVGRCSFVGPHTDPNSDSNLDVDHAGVSGETIAEVEVRTGTALGYLNSPYSKSIVLFLAGANDANDTPEVDLNDSADSFEAIIEDIYAVSPNIYIFVGLGTPNGDGSDDARVTTLNGLIETKISDLETAHPGIRIYTVDHNAAFKANTGWASAYMSDNTHPNQAGYTVMARTWAASLETVFDFQS